MTKARSVSDSSVVAFRNVLINGGFSIDQRFSGTARTIVAGDTIANGYVADRWYNYCTGANITGQRIAGTAPSQHHYRLTGATSNTGFGLGQRIEAANSFHLAGRVVTLSVNISSTSLTSITWTAFRANTTDTFGTLASPTRTQIATGTFQVSSTLGTKIASFVVPADATTGIEIVFTGGALVASQTVTFDDAQLEVGSSATSFEQRPIGLELALCQRYFVRIVDPAGSGVSNGVTTNGASRVNVSLPVEMRIIPTSISGSGTFSIWDGTNAPSGTLTNSVFGSKTSVEVEFTLTSAVTAGKAVKLYTSGSTSKWIDVGAEL